MKKSLTSVLYGITFFTLMAQAQIVDKKITHIVKSGETLHSITRDYLGTDILWQENWKLNPQVQNPNLLSIGQKLTIIEERIVPAEKATMIEVINKVEIKIPKQDWKKASLGDELNQKEGIKTYGKSSALLKFNDESELKILEYSQVFLQSRQTTLSGTDSATIEITKGDAELTWEPIKAGYSDITLISGKTKLKPTIETGKTASLRASITKQGNSVVSMYKGQSNIESAGAIVKIPQGMGLRVKPGQAPPQPKPLLKAPKVSANTKTYNYSNPIVHWNKVDGASNYLLEMCSDKNCNSVILQNYTQQNHLQVNHLNDKGLFFWRVAAVSLDEIVGYKSTTNSLSIRNAKEDKQAPVIAVNIQGIQKIINDKITVSPSSKIKIITFDKLSGVKDVEYKINDGEWKNYSKQVINMPQPGSKLTVKATDNLDQSAIKTFDIL